MSLIEHAEYELQKAGLLNDDSDYNGMVGRAVLDIVKKFSTQGHSGGSAMMTIALLQQLLRYEPLTPLTSDPEEWKEVDVQRLAPSERQGLWQSRRRPSTFSRDGGQTWYDIEDPSLNNGDVHVRPQWRQYYLGDESVRPGAKIRVKPDAYSAGSGLTVNGKEGTFAGARNGYAYIKYTDSTDDNGGAPHRANFLEVWLG